MKMSLGHPGKRKLFGGKEKPTVKVKFLRSAKMKQERSVLTI